MAASVDSTARGNTLPAAAYNDLHGRRQETARVGAADAGSFAQWVGLASLPQTLAEAIVSYAVDEKTLGFGARPSDKPVVPVAFMALASVSKAWFSVLDAIASSHALRSIVIGANEHFTRADMMKIRNRLILRRVWTQSLTIKQTSLSSESSSEAVWSAALAHVPLLTTLELCEPLSIAQDSQVDVVRAAARLCPHVETLVLPDDQCGMHHSDYLYRPDGLMDTLVATVFESAAIWRESNRTRGLTRLRMTLDSYVAEEDVACAYIEDVVEICPNIQVLEGSLHFFALVDCEEQWLLDLTTWEQFCRTCTQLREFNWVCVPYATVFFELFGRYLKPQLKKLSLMTPRMKWDEYIRHIDPETSAAIESRGYGPTAKNVLAVLEACPALDELLVCWYNSSNEMDIEIFGDEFYVGLVKSCPKPTSLTVTQVNKEDFAVRTIQSLTDASLETLSRLPDLRSVVLGGCNFTGAGLIGLLTKRSQYACRFELHMGEYTDGAAALIFDRVLVAFLELLAKHNEPIRRRMTLHVINDTAYWLDETQCLDTIAKVQTLAELARMTHPAIRLEGLVTVVGAPDEERFKRVREFIVATDGMAPPPWKQNRHNSEDVAIDRVLVLRRLTHAEDSEDGVGS